MGFSRAKTAYDEIVNNKLYINDAAKSQIVALAKKAKVYDSGGDFGSVSGNIISLDSDYIQYKAVGSLTDPIDDMYTALGKFTFRVLVEGSVSVSGTTPNKCHNFTISKIGIYIRDSYDFSGTQFLGYWNSSTNYGGINPLKGDSVWNSDFRTYSTSKGKGVDFLVYSDIKVISLNPTEKFIIKD